eukprot:SAG31_NODE_1966_length_6786_cov_7.109167_6_plen_258_part_00
MHTKLQEVRSLAGNSVRKTGREGALQLELQARAAGQMLRLSAERDSWARQQQRGQGNPFDVAPNSLPFQRLNNPESYNLSQHMGINSATGTKESDCGEREAPVASPNRALLLLSPEMLSVHQEWRQTVGRSANVQAELQDMALTSTSRRHTDNISAQEGTMEPSFIGSVFDVARPGTAVGLTDRIARTISLKTPQEDTDRNSLVEATDLVMPNASQQRSSMGEPLLNRIWTVVWPEDSDRIAQHIEYQRMSLPLASS